MSNTGTEFIQWTLYQNVCDKLKENSDLEKLSEAFGHLKSDEERVRFVLDLAVVDQVVEVKPCYTPKSSSKSNELRTVGNKFFQQKLFHKALEKYNESILVAPESDTKTAALAYANRSAALFHLSEHKLCLKDIQASLDLNYPKEITYKVLDRRARCLKLLGRTKEAILVFNEATKSLENSKLKGKEKITWEKEQEKQLKQCSEDDHVKLPKRALDMIRAGLSNVPELKNGENIKYIAASKAFEIITSSSKGRYPVACQDIDIGDVLVLEKPFASVLLPEHQNTHCHHCLKRVIAPLPCRQCANVRFCSHQCANDSWQLYHSFECKYLQHIQRAGKYGHLALRTLLKAGLVHCKEEASSRKSEDVTSELLGFNNQGVYDPRDYAPIYNLVGHTELRTVGDLFRRTTIAVYLLKCIEQTGFFLDSTIKDEFSGNLNKCFAFAGGIILRHLQSFPCNAHEISELQLSLKSVETSVTMETGAGIYATLSLFNHSCDPNVTRFFYGDKCVVRALRSITTGQEIADNYGVLSALTPINDRRSMLKSQYYFRCNCLACVEDAPLFTEIAAIKHPTLCCGHCKVSLPEQINGNELILCVSCHKEQDISFKLKLLDKSEKRLSEAVEKLFQGDVKNSLPHIHSHLRILEKNVQPPWHGFNNCKELIKQCYNILANCHLVD